ncbi:hypothetical protein [Flindersiella endophytica]
MQTILQAGDLINEIQAKLGEIKTLLLTIIGVAGVWIVFKVWWQTKAIVAAAIAIFTVALVLWGVTSVDWLKGKLGTELTSTQAVVVMHAIDPSDKQQG